MFVNDITQRCPGCIRALEETPDCPHCGTPWQPEQAAPFLPLRTILAQGRFGLGCAVEQNGDGITYLGFDEQTRQPVYVREFFPAAIALREQGQLVQAVMQGCEALWHDCAQNFMEVWRKLQRLRGLSALLAVVDVFEENGTIYAVYEYAEAITLREFLLRGKLGYISWERARALLMPVLSTLGSLHQAGIIHRGISPNTLFFGSDGKVRIGGFSIWQARTAHGDLTAELTDGYAALEQYGLDGQQGAWTDIYAFAAVLYRSLVGSDPDDAVSRRHNDRVMVPAQFAERIPAYVINALINAMQVFPEDRTRSVEQFRAELSASPTAVAQSRDPFPRKAATSTLPRMPKVPVAQPPKKKVSSGVLALKTAGIILGAGVLILAIIVAAHAPTRSRVADFFGSSESVTEAPPPPQRVEVPELEGLDYEDAGLDSFELEFNIVYINSDTYPEGEIIRQDIAAGASVAPGSVITLTVSQGPDTVELPRVVGRDIDDVREQLEDLGFALDITERVNDGSQEPGAVRSVHPGEGEHLLYGQTIFIQIWGPVNGAENDPAEEETEEE